MPIAIAVMARIYFEKLRCKSTWLDDDRRNKSLWQGDDTLPFLGKKESCDLLNSITNIEPFDQFAVQKVARMSKKSNTGALFNISPAHPSIHPPLEIDFAPGSVSPCDLLIRLECWATFCFVRSCEKNDSTNGSQMIRHVDKVHSYRRWAINTSNKISFCHFHATNVYFLYQNSLRILTWPISPLVTKENWINFLNCCVGIKRLPQMVSFCLYFYIYLHAKYVSEKLDLHHFHV